jgi:predicted nucleic acid-binding protein
MVTSDTNIAIYALTDSPKSERAEQAIANSDFLSVQVLNEYAWVAQRKLRRAWAEASQDVELLREWSGDIRSVTQSDNQEGMRIAERYNLQFFDALLVAVSLANGATTLYSEDMHHGLVIDGKLTITNPFLQPEPA